MEIVSLSSCWTIITLYLSLSDFNLVIWIKVLFRLHNRAPSFRSDSWSSSECLSRLSFSLVCFINRFLPLTIFVLSRLLFFLFYQKLWILVHIGITSHNFPDLISIHIRNLLISKTWKHFPLWLKWLLIKSSLEAPFTPYWLISLVFCFDSSTEILSNITFIKFSFIL